MAATLTLVANATATRHGARCLDGSRPGYYFAPAKTSATNTSWVLFFKGGGWCWDLNECASTANGGAGSTNHALKRVYLTSPLVGPTFAQYNRVLLWYCDGASFAGDRAEPAIYHPERFHHGAGTSRTAQPLHFRGLANLRAILDDLRTRHGLSDATDVLLTGASAGGLAAILHADRVHAWLLAEGTPLRRYRAAPISGFFPARADAAGQRWADAMRHVFEMQQAAAGVNAACAAALPRAQRWRCFLANYSYAFSVTPTFPLQSSLDLWQLRFAWPASCAARRFANCTASPDEVASLEGHASGLLDDLQRPSKARRAGEGGYVHACVEHMLGLSSTCSDGGAAMREALARWWSRHDGGRPHERAVDGRPSDGGPMWWLPSCQFSVEPPHVRCSQRRVRSGGEYSRMRAEPFR